MRPLHPPEPPTLPPWRSPSRSAGRPYYRNRLWNRPPPGTSRTDNSAGELVETEEEETSPELLTELCANIDDMTRNRQPTWAEKLMEAGALDTWQESVCMKKGRLAVKVCALCQPEQTDRVREAFFRHSSTPGIRQHGMLRHILRRESAPVHTPHGTVHVKTSFHARPSPLPESGI